MLSKEIIQNYFKYAFINDELLTEITDIDSIRAYLPEMADKLQAMITLNDEIIKLLDISDEDYEKFVDDDKFVDSVIEEFING
jgi:hypothetical protein